MISEVPTWLSLQRRSCEDSTAHLLPSAPTRPQPLYLLGFGDPFSVVFSTGLIVEEGR